MGCLYYYGVHNICKNFPVGSECDLIQRLKIGHTCMLKSPILTTSGGGGGGEGEGGGGRGYLMSFFYVMLS